MSEQRVLVGCGALVLLGGAIILIALAAILALSTETLIVFVLIGSGLGALIAWSAIIITSAINNLADKIDRS